MPAPILSDFRPMFDPPTRQERRQAAAATLRDRAHLLEQGASPQIVDWSDLAREERTKADRVAVVLAQALFGSVPENLSREAQQRVEDAALTAVRSAFKAWNAAAFDRAMDAFLDGTREDFGGHMSRLFASLPTDERYRIAFFAVKTIVIALSQTYAQSMPLAPAEYLRVQAAVTEAGGRL